MRAVIRSKVRDVMVGWVRGTAAAPGGAAQPFRNFINTARAGRDRVTELVDGAIFRQWGGDNQIACRGLRGLLQRKGQRTEIVISGTCISLPELKRG